MHNVEVNQLLQSDQPAGIHHADEAKRLRKLRLPCRKGEWGKGAAVSKPRITGEQVRKLLERECRAAGGQQAWADLHNISAQYVGDVIRGRRDPGEAMSAALGLRRVVLYEAAP